MKQHSGSRRLSIRPAWLLAAAAIIFGAGIAATASAPQGRAAKPGQPAKASPPAKPVPEPPVKDMSPDEEDAWATAAEQTADKVCSGQCHPIAEITRTRHTWRQWNESVVSMAALGVTATDEELTTIKLYMTRYYGAVNVNTASAAELSATLGLSSKDATAIVEYRKAHGKFADAAALAKVEGIDRSKIEEQPDALRFD